MVAKSLVEFKDKRVYNLTAEEEDIKYGCLKTFTEKTQKELLSSVDPEDLHKYLRTHDLVWEGWHAAFIASKEVKPTYVVGKVNRVLGKMKLNDSTPMVAEETKVSLDSSEDDSEDDSEVIPTEFRNEFAVAILAYEVVLYFLNWPRFKLMFPKDVYDPLVERLFEAAVKLVLSIFDKEDFQRICYRFQIKNEHTDFYLELFDEDDHHKTISRLKSKFPNLWELDIYDALHQVVYRCQFAKMKPLKLDATVRKMDPCYVSKALELMKKYVPLKVNIKKQLLLEHADRKCFHVTDALVLQAIHSVDLPCIIDDCNGNEKMLKLLYELADAVLDGFNDLTLTKASEMVFAEQRVTAPIIHQFGPCEHEVIDVIKLANHERMLSNARFIGEEHILSALSLSRVRDFVENMEIDTELRYQGGSSELYTYELYQLSSHLAKKKDGVAKWGLEHLVFSFLFGSSKENLDKCFDQQSELLKSLRLCKSKYSVPCWRNVDVLMVLMEKRCRYGETYTCNGREVVDKLYEEIRSGNLKLPRDEELFAML